MTSALLTLADSRLPAGGHTHSGGVEQAIAAGLVHDPASLAGFLLRRLTTSGAVAAGLAAAAATTLSSSGRHRGQELSPVALSPAGSSSGEPPAPASSSPIAALRELDAEADARTPSPALRAASRQQGRGLVRVGRRAWPSAARGRGRRHGEEPFGVAALSGGAAGALYAASHRTVTTASPVEVDTLMYPRSKSVRVPPVTDRVSEVG